jgi:hypothetical protein
VGEGRVKKKEEKYTKRFYDTWKSGDWGIRSPSLYHCTVGIGFPVNWVLNWAELPSWTITSLIGVTVGATSVLSGAKERIIIIIKLTFSFYGQ